MLNEHSYETLHRTERRTVDHDRTVFLVILTGVFEFETLRQVIVHLDGTELPAATECVLDQEVEFRTIESGFTGLFACRKVHFLTCLTNRVLCLLPDLV